MNVRKTARRDATVAVTSRWSPTSNRPTSVDSGLINRTTDWGMRTHRAAADDGPDISASRCLTIQRAVQWQSINR